MHLFYAVNICFNLNMLILFELKYVELNEMNLYYIRRKCYNINYLYEVGKIA